MENNNNQRSGQKEAVRETKYFCLFEDFYTSNEGKEVKFHTVEYKQDISLGYNSAYCNDISVELCDKKALIHIKTELPPNADFKDFYRGLEDAREFQTLVADFFNGKKDNTTEK